MVGDTGSQSSELVPEPAKFGVGSVAPEIQAPDEGWINSEPLTIAGNRGKVVLIDIWTYTCINCIRTLPFLKAWDEKYRDQGLMIIGVHSPEFEFEKIKSNVDDAALEYGLEYAIVQDNDFLNWRAYESQFWTAKYLIDKNGIVCRTRFGEGQYEETEHLIK